MVAACMYVSFVKLEYYCTPIWRQLRTSTGNSAKAKIIFLRLFGAWGGRFHGTNHSKVRIPISRCRVTHRLAAETQRSAFENGHMQLKYPRLPSALEARTAKETTLCRCLPFRTMRCRPLLVGRGQSSAVLHRGEGMKRRTSSRNLPSGRLNDVDEFQTVW